MQTWFLATVAGIVVVAGVVIAVARRRKSTKTRTQGSKAMTTASGTNHDAASSRQETKSSGVGNAAESFGVAGTARSEVPARQPEVVSNTQVIAAPLAPPVASMFCQACNKRSYLAAPVDLETVVCETCHGPLARIISCPHCKQEMVISKEFFIQYSGSQIACSSCHDQFVLKFD